MKTRGPVVWAYLRVSTPSQDEKRQLPGILCYIEHNSQIFEGLVLHSDNIVRDHGKSGYYLGWKLRRLCEIMDQSAPGDHLVVSSLSRLGRRLSDLIDFMDACNQKHIAIHTVEEDLLLLPESSRIYSDNSVWAQWSKWKLGDLAAKVEARSKLVGHRSVAGKLSANPRFMVFNPHKGTIIQKLKDGISLTDISSELGVEYHSLTNFVYRNNLLEEAGLPERRHMPHKVFEPHEDTIVQMLQEGSSIMEISSALGTNHHSLRVYIRSHRVMAKAGLQEARNRFDQRRNIVLQKLKQGMRQVDIARELGIKDATLRAFICRNRLSDEARMPE